MGNSYRPFHIERFFKPGKDTVVDLDGVEYLMNDDSVAAIKRGDREIPLIQLYDGKRSLVNLKDIEDSLKENGVIDYVAKLMKCPSCGKKMQVEREDTSHDSRNNKQYNRTLYTCRADDVWVEVEIPKTSHPRKKRNTDG